MWKGVTTGWSKTKEASKQISEYTTQKLEPVKHQVTEKWQPVK